MNECEYNGLRNEDWPVRRHNNICIAPGEQVPQLVQILGVQRAEIYFIQLLRLHCLRRHDALLRNRRRRHQRVRRLRRDDAAGVPVLHLRRGRGRRLRLRGVGCGPVVVVGHGREVGPVLWRGLRQGVRNLRGAVRARLRGRGTGVAELDLLGQRADGMLELLDGLKAHE